VQEIEALLKNGPNTGVCNKAQEAVSFVSAKQNPSSITVSASNTVA